MIAGIDPGAKGAIMVYDRCTGEIPMRLDLALCYKDRRIDPVLFTRYVDRMLPHIDLVVLEDVHSMPRDGHVGAFSFGHSCGFLLGWFTAHDRPVIRVKPEVWKGALGLTRDKAACRARAKREFPADADLFKRVMDDGRAEAALLAWFGRRYIRGKGELEDLL